MGNNNINSLTATERISRIFYLAFAEIAKTCRGAVLGWAWLFIKPLVYILVLWFALAMGLRAGSADSSCPYIVWLSTGLIAWFFMSDMLSGGSNVYKRYSYLVNRIKFPMLGINAFFTLSKLIIYVASMIILLVICVFARVPLSIHLIQLPFIALVMYVFWFLWSVITAPLCSLSKDFFNLIKTLVTPLFWISGIIYDVSFVPIPAIQSILSFNPVTFFAQATRAAVCNGTWIWEDPFALGAFGIVFVLTALVAVYAHKRFRTVVADAL